LSGRKSLASNRQRLFDRRDAQLLFRGYGSFISLRRFRRRGGVQPLQIDDQIAEAF